MLVSIQPDGDVLVALPRDAVDGGRFDERSLERLGMRLRRLAERMTSATPLWGVDALQALCEIAGVVGGVASGALLLWNGFEELTTGVMAHAGATAAALLLPAVLARLRPWLVRSVLPWLVQRL